MTATIHRFGRVRLEVGSRTLFRDGLRVELRASVFDGLLYLIENRHRAVGRDELAAAVLQTADATDAQINQLMLRMRRAVGDTAQNASHLRTVPRFGYQWIAPVCPHEEAIAAPLPSLPQRPAASTFATGRRRHLPLWIVAAACLVAAGSIRHTLRVAPVTHPASATAVMVLPAVVDGEASAQWVRLGAMDAIAGRLRQAGLPVPASERTLAWMQTRVPEGTSPASLDAESVFVQPRLVRTARGWRAELAMARRENGAWQAQADAQDPIGASRLASDRLLTLLGHKPPVEPGETVAGEEILQRAEAALLGHQLELARAILDGAPEGALTVAQHRYALARVDFRAGRYRRVEDELGALLASEALSGQPGLRAGALVLRGKARVNADLPGSAIEDFSSAIAIGDFGLSALDRGEAFAGRAAANGAIGDYAAALHDVGQARLLFGRMGDRLALAQLDMIQGTMAFDRRHYGEAQGLFAQAEPVFAAFGALSQQAHVASGLTAIALRQADPSAAMAASDKAWRLYERLREPEQRLVILSYRVDALLAAGRLSEASALLDAAATLPPPGNERILGHLEAQRAEVALAADDAPEARRRAERALTLMQPTHGRDRVLVARTRQQALLALDQIAQARTDLAGLTAEEGTQASGRFALLLMRAELALHERGGLAAAEPDFAESLTAAEAEASPKDLALVVESYAGALLDARRYDDAAAVIERARALAGRDYALTLTELRLYRALGQTRLSEETLGRIEHLAGERPVAAELRSNP